MSKRISRRKFVQDVAIGALGVAAGPTVHVQAAPTFDLIIRGATILDGTGAPAYAADLYEQPYMRSFN